LWISFPLLQSVNLFQDKTIYVTYGGPINEPLSSRRHNNQNNVREEKESGIFPSVIDKYLEGLLPSLSFLVK